ncbi:MAG TPA: M20/M25/M40 family metallo-hydrolase, partial [Hyphomonadaceae bacterium]|nr:M20/M25/M40 family metallo-hydrolase [Hyphomonadaceae bacterium]
SLQTLISREIDPLDAGVVTVGVINGGAKNNIIPDEVKMQLTVRSFADATREKLLSGIDRIARAESQSGSLTGDKAPITTVRPDGTPSLYNDPVLAGRVADALKASLGEDKVVSAQPTMGGEDFSRYGRTADKIPGVLFWLGAVPKEKIEASQRENGPPLPALHSSGFAPDPDPTIAAGVKSLVSVAMEILK